MFLHVKNVVVVCVLCVLAIPAAAAEGALTPEEVLHRHLDSIGKAEVRAAAKTRVIEGKAVYRILVSGSGSVDGKAVLASEGRKFNIVLKVNALQYRGEQFICDGAKTSVAGTYEDKSRSEFGQFLRAEDLPLREGLLGGVLSTSWPLLDLDSRKAKLRFEGLKDVDDRKLYALSYHPKKSTDMTITLYFEPETFRHVMTVYNATVHAGIRDGESPYTGGFPTSPDVDSARQQETRYKIEERFSEFKSQDGLMLPSHYDLRFQEELQSGFTKLVEWDINTTRVLSNVTLDPRNFEVH
ncbi:MAG TPA: hypothetical protein VMT28_18160 [Terriglobales bacterium]|jgi:hypothetical protein|nr:hypothetical protein [Terriglobales bacterium]